MQLYGAKLLHESRNGCLKTSSSLGEQWSTRTVLKQLSTLRSNILIYWDWCTCAWILIVFFLSPPNGALSASVDVYYCIFNVELPFSFQSFWEHQTLEIDSVSYFFGYHCTAIDLLAFLLRWLSDWSMWVGCLNILFLNLVLLQETYGVLFFSCRGYHAYLCSWRIENIEL